MEMIKDMMLCGSQNLAVFNYIENKNKRFKVNRPLEKAASIFAAPPEPSITTTGLLLISISQADVSSAGVPSISTKTTGNILSISVVESIVNGTVESINDLVIEKSQKKIQHKRIFEDMQFKTSTNH